MLTPITNKKTRFFVKNLTRNFFFFKNGGNQNSIFRCFIKILEEILNFIKKRIYLISQSLREKAYTMQKLACLVKVLYQSLFVVIFVLSPAHV